MTMRAGREQTANARPPLGVGVGAVPYVDADGFVAWLPYPEGAALGDYLLATGDDGVPVWIAAADLSLGGPEPVIEFDPDTGTYGFVVEDGELVVEDP